MGEPHLHADLVEYGLLFAFKRTYNILTRLSLDGPSRAPITAIQMLLALTIKCHDSILILEAPKTLTQPNTKP